MGGRVLLLKYLFIIILVSDVSNHELHQVFSWKQIGFNFDGVLYTKNADYKKISNGIYFEQELNDAEKFFIQYNNVPIGLEVYKDTVFITVPRRKHGIPSTLNYVKLTDVGSPLLKPFPDAKSVDQVYSVYRPRVDQCGRLWMVDTGLQEIPGERVQIRQPSIVVYDLQSKKLLLKHNIEWTSLGNNITSGLTSITVDVSTCEDTHAYITDLAGEGLVVYSLQQDRSWRIAHNSFQHEDVAMNFTVASHVINWRDGLFSLALTEKENGSRQAFYHPLVSTKEFKIDTQYLKNGGKSIDQYSVPLGTKGALTQSGSHDYHAKTRTLLFANVARDAILCWAIDTPLTPENMAIVAQDHKTLVYISDLKVVNDYVWVLVNQIPRFVYSNLNPDETNFYVHRGNVNDLIQGTPCERKGPL